MKEMNATRLLSICALALLFAALIATACAPMPAPGQVTVEKEVVVVTATPAPEEAAAEPAAPEPAPAAVEQAVPEALQANLEKIKLPPGFKIDLYAKVPGARSLVVSKPLPQVFVGSRQDMVHVVLDRNNDRVGDEVVAFDAGLYMPNGVAFSKQGFLYVAETERIIAYAAAQFDPYKPIGPFVIHEGFPKYDLHGWRYLAMGPDGKLYVALGANCNVCDAEEPQATILRIGLTEDGLGATDVEVYARGIRNSVGMDWHPVTGELFFTDNGADLMGDDIPADELNHAPEPGMHFGFPYYGGGRTKSNEFADQEPPVEVTFPVVEFQAHTANLGIDFYQGSMFPEEYKNDAFVAQHGSWNRTVPIGYRIMRIRFDENGQPVDKEVFAEGWLQEDGQAWGRPVDIEELPDGSLLVSDDFAGAIYRISYQGQ